RAIEIQDYQKNHPFEKRSDFTSVVFGIAYPRQTIMQRIRQRLEQRLHEGMVDEVQALIDNGVSPERLKRYGLEYRYVTQYILKEITYDQMLEQLNIAIRQFAKRQMTWFRRMERNGTEIRWIDPMLDFDEKIDIITETYKNTIK
ncbi:MAG: tRNA (adenosine(37)-N6)-dimethylallyltransferase MiaA, partial [Bacteroidales bacterium]|nr:tRNA (adenosine(37)-N6)-dimethylallyltransferase MiaA [Bacteroidales bacterium]